MTTLLTEKEIEAIATILMGQLEVPRDQITPEARLKEDLGADSLDLVEIVMKLEEEFGVTIPDELAEGVQTVEDAQETVAKLLGRRGN
jgi:acyl carrier protein